MNNYNDLDRVIEVENPLEPEKGGYYKAYKENYFCYPDCDYRTYHFTRKKLSPPSFDHGLKLNVPKLNIENQKLVNIAQENVAYSNRANSCPELRVMNLSLIKYLGLELKNERNVNIVISRSYKNSDPSYRQSYLSLIQEHKGFLVSLSEIKDTEFIKALDACAKANLKQKPKFDDAKYEPQFKKLEQYLNHFDYKIIHTFSKDKDKVEEEYCSFSRRNHGETNNVGGISFRNLHHYGATIYPDFWRVDEFQSLIIKKSEIPAPINFKSPNDYLKAGAHIVVNHFINDNPFEISDKYVPLVPDLAGTMFAAHLGVPLTQNDVNRFGCYFLSEKFPEQHSEAFKLAYVIVNALLDITLKKESEIKHPANKGLWDTWKRAHQDYALQMATPSLELLCKENNIALSRENVIDALNKTTAFKINSFAANKEQLKRSITNKEGLVNKGLENKANDLQKVITVSINQPQEKLATRPKEPDNTFTFELIPQKVSNKRLER